MMEHKAKQPLTTSTAASAISPRSSHVSRQTPAQFNGPASLIAIQRTHGNRFVQRFLAAAGETRQTDEVSPAIQDRIQRATGSGQVIGEAARDKMESAFGADFSGVRVHTDAEADALSRNLDARAFTVGQDIFFRGGEYDANSSSGRQLLAHELTHVVQQSGAVQTNLTVGSPDDVYEQEADRVSQNVARDLEPGVASETGARQKFVQQQKVQRDEAPSAEKDKPVTVGASGAAGATATKGKTTNIIFTANYHEVPGKGKDRVTPRETDDALWIDPLAVHSNIPDVDETMVSRGVVAGAGQQKIDTFAVPVTEGDSPVGFGSITPVLRFAGSLNASFDVTVDLPAGTKGEVAAETKARKAARTFLEEKMPLLGDIDVLEARTVDYLSGEGYPDAKVKISMKKNKTTELGQTTFYYRARNNPAILMEIIAQPVGEKESSYSKTESKEDAASIEKKRFGEGSVESTDIVRGKKEAERHHESSKEKVDIEYDEAVVKTLDETVKRIDHTRTKLIENLAEEIVKDSTYHEKDDWKRKELKDTFEDYTKKVKGYSESGKKDKENWAEWLKKRVADVKKIIKIPFLDKLPGGKWLNRKIKGWWLDVAEMGLGWFAEKGEVNYEDWKEDETVKKKTGAKEEETVTKDVDITRKDKETVKKELTKTMTTDSESDWKHYVNEITKIKKKYSSVTTKESAGGSEKAEVEAYGATTRKESAGGSDLAKESSKLSTTVSFSGTTTWKFTKPQIKATVVSGDGEVSDKPFTEKS